MFLNSKKFFIRLVGIGTAIVIGGLCFESSGFSAEIEKISLFATITKPVPGEAISPNMSKDPVLFPEEETFSIRGVAQPGKAVNLYSWSIVPGTDGNSNEDTTITGFRGEKTAADTVKFTWNPRTIFQREHAEETLKGAGKSCEVLKTRCLPEGQNSLGMESQTCEEGNVPLNFDCSIPKKYSVFHDIVKPDISKNHEHKGLFTLALPETEEELRNMKNNTLLLDPKCQSGEGCEYDGYAIGWRNTLKPASAEALLKEDLSPVVYDTLNVDEVNGFLPSKGVNAPGNPWAGDLIPEGTYTPNIRQDRYSGIYNFSYFTFVRAFNGNVTGEMNPPIPETYEAHSFFPAKDFSLLVDAFDQYEIYAVEDSEYAENEGITRENGTLVYVLRDPSLGEASVSFSSAGLDPAKKYRFALFEVRESGLTKLPNALREKISSKKVNAGNCQGDPSAPSECGAAIGHLVSTQNELTVDLASGEITEIHSPLKTEWQIFEQEGAYSSDPVRSDGDGEIRCGVNGNEECRFGLGKLNRLSSHHFLAGTYLSEATGGNTGNMKSFSIHTNRMAPDLSGIQTLMTDGTYFRNSPENLNGVAFNSWTKEILPFVEVELSGKNSSRSETISMIQKTSADGLFAFTVEAGEYFLNVRSLRGTEHTFRFPSTAYSVEENDTCGEDSIFAFLYCRKDLPISIEQESVFRNIPIDPVVRGKITGQDESVRVVLSKNGKQVSSTWTLPDGKFSFFLSPGEYVLSEIQDASGRTLLVPNRMIAIAASPDGHPSASEEVTLTIE